MRIRIDEAGDFKYGPDQLLRVSVVAGIVVPDGRWASVQEFVERYKRDYEVHELKAATMHKKQLEAVAEFIITEDLTIAAIATDSHIFPPEAQLEWRHRQVRIFRAAADRSRRALQDREVRERVERTRRRIHQTRHVSQPNFLQYAVLRPWLLAHLLSAGLLVYSRLSDSDEGWQMDIAMDAQPGADPGKAGDLLRDSLEAIFASDERTALRMPGDWPDDHPFKVKNNDPELGGVSVRQVLATGLKSCKSHEDPGLQLADFAAHLVLTSLREPVDAEALDIWRTLVLASRIMPTEDGWPIKAWAWPADRVADEDLRRYERLIPTFRGN
jgi:hypothetical protein